MIEQTKVTKAQFQKYVDVQMGGAYNMLDPRARDATGLSKEIYLEIMEKCSELSNLYPDVNP